MTDFVIAGQPAQSLFQSRFTPIKFMEKIQLETRTGQFIAYEYIMAMSPPPEVILWKERAFVLHCAANPALPWDAKEGTPTIYREGLMLPIPVPEFYFKLFRGK